MFDGAQAVGISPTNETYFLFSQRQLLARTGCRCLGRLPIWTYVDATHCFYVEVRLFCTFSTIFCAKFCFLGRKMHKTCAGKAPVVPPTKKDAVYGKGLRYYYAGHPRGEVSTPPAPYPAPSLLLRATRNRSRHRASLKHERKPGNILPYPTSLSHVALNFLKTPCPTHLSSAAHF